MSRDRLFTLVFFSNVFTDLYLITAIQKKVSGNSRSRDIFRWMQIRINDLSSSQLIVFEAS